MDLGQELQRMRAQQSAARETAPAPALKRPSHRRQSGVIVLALAPIGVFACLILLHLAGIFL
jgi:hypothetical protein